MQTSLIIYVKCIYLLQHTLVYYFSIVEPDENICSVPQKSEHTKFCEYTDYVESGLLFHVGQFQSSAVLERRQTLIASDLVY